MTFSPEQIADLNHLIQNRKSVAPNLFTNKSIEREILEQVLKNAHRAPSHKLTEPWRFKVLMTDKKKELGVFLAKKYKEKTPLDKFNERKYEGFPKKAVNSGAIILLCMQRDLEESIPEWEEVAALAMAVENMYLTCTAYNLGCYWSSPKLIEHLSEFVSLAEGERCFGIFYMGYYDKKLMNSPRSPLETKVQWLD